MVAVNTRIAERLNKLSDGSTEDRSKELPALIKKFEAFTKQFPPFYNALKAHHDAMVALDEAHSKVMNHIIDWTKDSPLAEGEENAVAVQEKLMKKNHTYSKRYAEYVVAYIREWETIVTTRVHKWIEHVKDDKKELDHYEKKVTGLKKTKHPDEAALDKIQRNDEKLQIARNEYISHVQYLCNLITEAVDFKWKDLHPLLYRMVNLDNDRLGDEAAILMGSGAIEKLKAIAATYDIDVTLPEPPKSEESKSEELKVKEPAKKRTSKKSAAPKPEEAPKHDDKKAAARNNVTKAPEPPTEAEPTIEVAP